MPPQTASPARVLRGAWRVLRRMRTAIILLLVLAAGSAVGSFFPQRPIQPGVVADWKAANPGWAPFAERLGLFDVYGAWWFMTIYVLLLVSLVGCIAPRYAAWARALRSRPRTTATLAVQPHYHAGTIALEPDAALRGAERVLRERRFRLARENGTLAAEKGHLREGGSLVFHTAILLLLFGMSVGKLFGHMGQVAVIEGETFRDTRIEYDSFQGGRLYRGHAGVELTLESFDVSWHPNGMPKEFVSHVRLTDGATEATDDVAVNSPMNHRGLRFHQLSWGWAPVLRLEQDGRVLYDGPTVFLTRGQTNRGVIKAPAAVPQQTGLDMLFLPDPEFDADGVPFNAGPEPDDPVVLVQHYLGDLGLERAQSVYTLDLRGMTLAETRAVRMGETVQLANGIELTFAGLKQYSVFQVSTNPGSIILLVAAILILVGLIPALYSSRRRVWVRAADRGGVVRVEIAGQALQRKAAFEEEFRALVRTIDRDLVSRIER